MVGRLKSVAQAAEKGLIAVLKDETIA